MTHLAFQKTPLGRPAVYAASYNPGLLCAIPRKDQRDALGITAQTFYGADVWRAYEVSWLNSDGLPQVAMGQCVVPSDSEMLIESKSMKLYLNALNQSTFVSKEEVATIIAKDFSDCTKALVTWQWLSGGDIAVAALSGACLDALPVVIDKYDVCVDCLTLSSDDAVVKEQVYSHVFKSNCLVTGQPDWASVHVAYEGRAIDHVGLLKYLVSYRLHQAFHEHCVERIWYDIHRCCQPERLTVSAYFTRRGGIDINPVRSSHPILMDSCLRLPHQ